MGDESMVIDADAHVVETEHTWDYLRLKPMETFRLS